VTLSASLRLDSLTLARLGFVVTRETLSASLRLDSLTLARLRSRDPKLT
jgi:hypothetical protein